jgi:MFS family permease
MVAGPMVRGRSTWLAYLLLGAFCYLQASPGPVVPFLRAELGLGYATAALHMTAFSVGALLAGSAYPALERRVSRTRTVWAAALFMGVATVLLTLGGNPVVTIGATFLMGALGTPILLSVQAALADQHGERRAVALTEANAVASAGSLAVPAAVAAAEAAGLGWRAGILAILLAFAALAVAFRGTRLAPPPTAAVLDPAAGSEVAAPGRLPRRAVAALVLVLGGAAIEWCVSFWAATFLSDVVGLPATAAVAVTTGFYAAMLAGRAGGSVLAGRWGASRLVGAALVVTGAGIPLFWLAPSAPLAVTGLIVTGLGVSVMFPLGLALAMAAAPLQAARVSARMVQVGAAAIGLLPLALGALAGRIALRPAFAIVPALLLLAAAGWLGARPAPARAAATPTPAVPGTRTRR